MKAFCVVAVLWASSAPAEAAELAGRVDLSPLGVVAVQHRQTVKTLESYARQALYEITGKDSLDGHDAVFTLLDMTYHPESYAGRNLIKIKNAPLRAELAGWDALPAEDRARVAREGTVSLTFWRRRDVRAWVQRTQAADVRKAQAVGQLAEAASLLEALEGGSGQPFPPVAVIPPAPGEAGDAWRTLPEVAGNVPEWVVLMVNAGVAPPEPAAGYDDVQLQRVADAAVALGDAWRAGDAAGVDRAAAALGGLLPAVNPAVYPSLAKRKVEVVYGRWSKMTLPAAAFYFAAFVCFLTSSYGGVSSPRRWGLRLMAAAFVVHTAGVAVRWWLVGGVFPPIKNEFESVLFSAWFGAAVGLGLEWRRGRGIYGAAASFVGWMSLVALFAVPFVTGTQIGGEVGQVSGVLMSYWLYVHVTLVTAAYALIGMGFLLGVWWLTRYYGVGVSAKPSRDGAPSLLATLDQCNLVVLQLAFWVLGAGIVCGAVWADRSWGRPWGWDPKETFALVTWIVYLVVVHVRVAVADKAWWTAVLAVAGFFVMLFNWIGVNFFLTGLHSYA